MYSEITRLKIGSPLFGGTHKLLPGDNEPIYESVLTQPPFHGKQARNRMHRCIPNRSLYTKIYTSTISQFGHKMPLLLLLLLLPFSFFMEGEREIFLSKNSAVSALAACYKFWDGPAHQQVQAGVQVHLILNVHCTSYPTMRSLSLYLSSFESWPQENNKKKNNNNNNNNNNFSVFRTAMQCSRLKMCETEIFFRGQHQQPSKKVNRRDIMKLMLSSGLLLISMTFCHVSGELGTIMPRHLQNNFFRRPLQWSTRRVPPRGLGPEPPGRRPLLRLHQRRVQQLRRMLVRRGRKLGEAIAVLVVTHEGFY